MTNSFIFVYRVIVFFSYRSAAEMKCTQTRRSNAVVGCVWDFDQREGLSESQTNSNMAGEKQQGRFVVESR